MMLSVLQRQIYIWKQHVNWKEAMCVHCFALIVLFVFPSLVFFTFLGRNSQYNPVLVLSHHPFCAAATCIVPRSSSSSCILFKLPAGGKREPQPWEKPGYLNTSQWNLNSACTPQKAFPQKFGVLLLKVCFKNHLTLPQQEKLLSPVLPGGTERDLSSCRGDIIWMVNFAR